MTLATTARRLPGEDGQLHEITLAEFIQKYDYIIRSVIRRLVPRDLGDPDDLSQQIWTEFIAGKEGRSYFEIYDPSLGAPTTFLFEFARLRCMQFLSRSNRTPTARAYSIQSQPEEGFIPGVIDPETHPALGFDEFESIEYEDLVKRATAAIHRHRQRGRRDLRWVWYLVRRGYQQDQIAREMGLSEGTISICMDLIRQIPEVQELRTWGFESGLLTRPRPS